MIQNKRVIIVAHYLLYGAAHALRDYLLEKNIDKLLCIFLPLSSQRSTFFNEYIKTKSKKISLKTEKEISRKLHLGPLDYILDILQTIWYIDAKNTYEVYIGVDALNCLSGLFLKKIGRVKKVVFYSIDFVPVRFSNFVLNFIYHQIEIYCVKHADAVWNVSPRIAEGREKFLKLSIDQYTQEVVPIGVWNNKVKKRPFHKIYKQQLLFLGHLLEKQGVQLVLEAMPLVIKKIPKLKLLIVGGGEYLPALQQKTKKLSLEKYVSFTGWVSEREKIDKMMSESAIALATYKPEKKRLYNFTYYADPTKLKDYLSAGLPIILTNISYNAEEIAKKKCGILVEYKKEAIAQAIIKLLTNEKTLIEYRRNSLTYAKDFDWEQIFKRVTI